MQTSKYYLYIEHIEDIFLDLTKEQIKSIESVIETCRKTRDILPLFQMIADFSKYSNKEINYISTEIDGSDIEISPLSIEDSFIEPPMSSLFDEDIIEEEEIIQEELENEEDD